jgi:hypothetical protein
MQKKEKFIQNVCILQVRQVKEVIRVRLVIQLTVTIPTSRK